MRIRFAIAALILLTTGGISGKSGGDTGTCLGREAFGAQVEIDACTRALAALPASHARRAELLAHRGQAFYKLRNYDAAIDDLEHAVAARGDVAEWHYWRGQAYQFGGKGDEAIAAYTRALALDDDMPGASINRAMIRGPKGDIAGSLQDLNDVLKRHPDHIVALINRSLMNAQAGDFTASLADAEHVLALEPGEHATMLFRARALSELHRHKEAIAAAGEALALGSPHELALLSIRSRAYIETAAYDLARADIATLETLQDPCLICLDPRLALHLRRGEYKDAVKVAGLYVDLLPNLAASWNNRCYARAGAGDPKTALADCNRAIEMNPRSVNIWNSRAVVYLLLRDYDAARADFERAAALNDRTGFSQYGLGLVRLRLGQTKEGNADIAAVNATLPSVGEEYARFGLRP